MKVGLLTYHFSDNYGALFQAYALREWFHQRNIDAEFLNYHPSYVEEGGTLEKPWKIKLWRKNLTIMYMKFSHIQRTLMGNKVHKASFDDFRYHYLGVSKPRRKTVESLYEDVKNKNMLVCGSDQIWNPSIQKGLDPVYFLDIPGAEHIRKVAYAPSFGRTSIEDKYNKELLGLISRIDAISVRESTGIDIINKAGNINKELHVVPDPTILLGNFDKILKDNLPVENKVFCYALRTDEVIREVATIAGSHIEGTIVSPRSTRQRWTDIGLGIAPGPVEWLRTLARSKVVVSNSFHGIALSIVLNRPFIAVSLPGKKSAMNARAHNLLKIAGLTHRIVDHTDKDRIITLLDTPIDWKQVNIKLTEVRENAEVYLANQIELAQQEVYERA
ncbi:polysaccharide pyruvyl transferase family protein [Cobetia amphilecti]|uniref:polysaccharide pyruvyl transferase family protein n=1 Tax=Cobetia amphilecti TaxID=1055104 RepID=UPI0032971C75